MLDNASYDTDALRMFELNADKEQKVSDAVED